ncbi:MAG: F0F1 ATP synthase subunit alpha, partial [Candidatus Dormibacteraeota bacterium]|nr:F0F1 ATP synthase subunit alpha [Candidatus Dormibacteraeota bacterium]
MPLGRQVIAIFAGGRGYLDDVPIDRVGDFERSLLRYIDQNKADLAQTIERDGRLSEETESWLKAAIEDFKKGYAG